jgi:hypothetical protein
MRKGMLCLLMVICGSGAVSEAVASHVPGCTIVVPAYDEHEVLQTFEGCTTEFQDDFDSGKHFSQDGWHKTQMMGDPSNVVQIVKNRTHSGVKALGAYTVASPDQQKASLARELLWFPAQTHFYFSAWYYIKGGTNTQNLYLFDLESTKGLGNPGRRLMLTGEGGIYLMVNSKRAGLHAEQIAPRHAFPKDKWVRVTMHAFLSQASDGYWEVWQDGVKIISAAGANMPEGLYYDWIEVGITANMSGQSQVVFVDDMIISKSPIP